MSDIRIAEVDGIDCRYEPQRWAFADENSARIADHWAEAKARKPAMFNGQILLMHRWDLSNRVLRGAYLMTDYASFLAWRDFGHPDPDKWNCFAMAALQAADGAFLLGEMAGHTANAGLVYFAAGTPDPSDLSGDVVDLSGSVMREMAEETGVTAEDVTIEAGWTVVFNGPSIALMRRVRSPLKSLQLKARIERFLATDAEPELSRMHIVSGLADILPDRMPAFQSAYLQHCLAGR